MAGVGDSRNLLGILLLGSLVLGGGTARGLAIDSFLRIAMVCVSAYAVVRLWQRPSSGGGRLLFGLLLCIGLIQMIPLPVSLLANLRPSVYLPFLPSTGRALEWSTITLSTSRTVFALIVVLCDVALFMALHRLGRGELAKLLPLYFAGVFVNILVVFFNYSSGGCCNLAGPLGYDFESGLFANQNHLSTLLCASIPMATYGLAARKRRYPAVLAILLILVALLAIGSRAGILIGFTVLVLSLLSVGRGMRPGGIATISLLVIITVYGYGAFVRIGGEVAETTLERRQFVLTTLRALRENWVLGTGYGSFDLVYPHYERLEDIYPAYVNHAHNDFLEIALEGGLAGAMLVAFYLVAVLAHLVKTCETLLQRLSFLSICVVLVHSTVDYPLRTVAVAAAFAFFNALFFAVPDASPVAPPPDRAASGGRWGALTEADR